MSSRTFKVGESVTPLTRYELALLNINPDDLRFGYVDRMIIKFAGKPCIIKHAYDDGRVFKLEGDEDAFTWDESMFREYYFGVATPIYGNVLTNL